MRVQKRNGKKEEVSFDKVINRLKSLCTQEKYGTPLNLEVINIAQKVVSRIYDEVKTTELDELAGHICTSMITEHPDYGLLASRIIISNNHKNTSPSFSETISMLYNNKNIFDHHTPLVSEEVYNIVIEHKSKFNDIIDYSRDFEFDYFAFKTLEKAYLMKINKVIIERIQHLFLRVAIGLHKKDMKRVIETYDLMSTRCFTHATPTLFHAGTNHPQLLSCFLMGIDDSITGIYKCLANCAQISKWAGGIGIHISNIRAKNSIIRGTNGVTSGIVPMLRVFNDTARYVNQSGRRQGSFAIYIEPWHADTLDFLDLKKNHGDENARARDLFYAVWIPDLFMERVEQDKEWSLFCPDECRGLTDAYGDEFSKLYESYESQGKARKTLPAREIWKAICVSQIETGTPYILYKNAANSKSNQKNVGTIRSSNLCVAPETLVLTDKGHIKIKSLENKTVHIWNGKEFSEVTIYKTGENQKLITIVFSDDTKLTCTPYHKFYIQTKYSFEKKKDILQTSSVKCIEAKELKSNMKIVKCEYPIIDGKIILKNAYTNGLFSGDGTYSNITNQEPRKCKFKAQEGKAFCKRHIDNQINNEISEKCSAFSYEKKPCITLYHDKIKLLEHISYRSHGKIQNNKLNVCLPLDLKEKFFIPFENYSLNSKLEWFAGYCDADGCIVKNDKTQLLQIGCIHKKVLLNVKLMLQTCGISSKLNFTKRTENLLPDSNRNLKLYKVKNIWRLLISSTQLQKLVSIGFQPKRLIIEKHTPQRNSEHFIKISKVVDEGRIDNTFCFNESKRHAGIFNGIMTSQCTEILEYSNDKEYACCTLASICLSKCVVPKNFDHIKEVIIYTKNDCNYCKMAKMLCKKYKLNYIEINLTNQTEAFNTAKKSIKERFNAEFKTYPQILINYDTYIGGYTEFEEYTRPYFNFNKLAGITGVVTNNLDKIIDLNYYPVPETKLSNERHRPLGIGVQGLADVYCMMRYPFDSPRAAQLNKEIFATIYYAGLQKSLELSKEHGQYSTFNGSPLSQGIFQFDMWDAEPVREVGMDDYKQTLNWELLKKEIQEHGVRNSLLLAPMPTASTSQIMGNNECIEPFTSNIYVRRTIAGDFVVINKYLLEDLIELGLWDKDMKDTIIYFEGSVAKIDTIPQTIRNLYKTSWELKQKVLIDQAVDRGAYICQSQSLNLFLPQPTFNQVNSMHFYSWKKGLKTGIYYLRTKGAGSAQQFTITPDLKKKIEAFQGTKQDVCENCSA
jgi:ribonucleoside-diphosphate reductase alpha chain